VKKFIGKFLVYLILAIFLLWPFDSRASFLWQQVGGNGLGDPSNTIVSTMEVWNNYIYAGIGRVSGSHARIYRSLDGSTWNLVHDGFGHNNLNIIIDFASFQGKLYVTTTDEAVPPVQAGEIWRSTDGVTWTQAGAEGLGNANNVGFYKMEEFNGQLYVGSRNETQGGKLYRTADGTNWNEVAIAGLTATNTAIWSLESFGGYLWFGTLNQADGTEVWRSTNGTNWEKFWDYAELIPPLPQYTNVNNIFGSSLLYWTAVNAVTGAHLIEVHDIFALGTVGGLGDANNIWFSEDVVLQGGLYLGTRNETTGGELWYTPDFENFSQIGLDGFGNIDNYAIYALAFKDYLYIGLSTVNGAKGAEIWRRLITYDFGITNKTLPQGTQGQSYSTQLETTGGTKPYLYRLVKGALPQGMELSPTGELKGTPQKLGDFQFVVEVQDSFKKVSKTQRLFSLKIVAGLSTGVESITILPKTGADLY